MTLQQFLLILRARFRVICGVLAIVVLAAAAVSLILPKKYTAQAALVVDAKSADPILGNMIPSQMMASYIATQVDIIGSDRVAQRVIDITGLDKQPQFQEMWQEATEGRGGIKVWLASALKSRLDVKPARESNVITLSYTGSNPEFVAMVVNAFAQAYIDTALELKVEPARQYANWFDERTKGLRDDLEAAQKRLSDYEQQHRIIASDGRLDVETARLAELSSQLVAVQGLRADSRSRQSQSGAAELLPEVTQSPLISNLKAELARKEAERDQLRGRLGPNHPEVGKVAAEIGSLRQRIGSETQRIAASLGTSSRISAAREEEIAAAVEAQKARVLELKAHRDSIAVLQRDVEAAQRAYDLVTQRLATTSLESQTQQTNVAVLTPATVPLWPSGPRLLVNLLLAIIVGGVLGVGSAFLIELADRRVRGEDDLASLADVPILGVIPSAGEALAGGFLARLFRRPAEGY
ncbi:chain length determinant protein EpsF [Azoarcus sp. TTM-91]|uniref:chain length determinant protein EpsF n=1 Tax=Azoarcus sp. TTM-91 TaxID=2691581 RepID=UPI00145EEC57|nr:chain length determinant protein EpsF [Azoarcus sp. TTM-91]NMG35874.1 chain length determinant protein EpsF [Azoarcus sp. TTM-91]